MDSVLTLKDNGINRRAVIFGTGPSAENPPVAEMLVDNYDWWEINGMKQPYNFQYSIYYDVDWKEYFQSTNINDGRKLISFYLNRCEKTDYTFDTQTVPFSDSGFHALWIASEIMKYDLIFLVGYDYTHEGDRWHWYENATVDGLNHRREKLLDRQVRKYQYPKCDCKDLSSCVCKPYRWYSKIYNTNSESGLKLFPMLGGS